jgi:hypothetical protein
VDYSEAISAVEGGAYAWRVAWSAGTYIYGNPVVEQYQDNGQGIVYVATGADKSATDWDSGDHPPHP